MDLVYFGTMSCLTAYLIYINLYLNFFDMLTIYSVGAGLSSTALVVTMRNKFKFGFEGTIIMKEFIKFGMPMTLLSAIHTMPRFLDIFIIQFTMSSTAIVGVYSSAKTLYKVFEEIANATYGLIYPSAVRQIERKNNDAIVALITKTCSFLTISILFFVILLESGIAEMAIKMFFPPKYHDAIGQFRLILLAAPALPFIVVGLVITASGKPVKVLQITTISAVFSFIVLYFIGRAGEASLLPLGIIVFNYIYGIQSIAYLKKKYEFPLSMLLRAFRDTKQFFVQKYGKSI